MTKAMLCEELTLFITAKLWKKGVQTFSADSVENTPEATSAFEVKTASVTWRLR